MRRWLTVLTTAAALMFLALQVYFYVSRGMVLPDEGWSAYELVVLILIALSVMLATLTIFLAVLGVWGYQAIRAGAVQRAETVARETAKPIASREARSWATHFQADDDNEQKGISTDDELTYELSKRDDGTTEGPKS